MGEQQSEIIRKKIINQSTNFDFLIFILLFSNNNNANNFPFELVIKYYRAFNKYLQADNDAIMSFGAYEGNTHHSGEEEEESSASSSVNPRQQARHKLSMLADAQFQELCTDMYDELERRKKCEIYSNIFYTEFSNF